MENSRPIRDSAAPALQEEYDTLVPIAERLRRGLTEQLHHIVVQKSLTLATPIESRIKTWSSIADKCERKEIALNTLVELTDLIGLRLIFLFSRDLKTAISALHATLSVIDQDNTAARLSASQFGYQSTHFIIKIPDGWTEVPMFAECGKFQVEIQLRTIAQHTWAAASHYLQYKREATTPYTMRRSINRVAALLETVDLEFERVLSEREEYVSDIASVSMDDESINVDILRAVLDTELPLANRKEDEPYDALITDLDAAGINTVKALADLIHTHREVAIHHDAEIVAGKHPEYRRSFNEREKTVFLAHVGLVRHMLRVTGKLP